MHFAKVKNNIVQQVIVAEQDVIDSFSDSNLWIQTSYNTLKGEHLLGGTPLRKNFAGVGFTYDATRDAFIAPKPPYDSWLLDEDTCRWKAPKELPDINNRYNWNEENQEWDYVGPALPE